jgi:hypothetical protein
MDEASRRGAENFRRLGWQIGERIDPTPDNRDQIIAELRAVVALVLDSPFELQSLGGYESEETERRCRFCDVAAKDVRVWTGRLDARGRKVNEWVDRAEHAPDCAVLRRDELLGR